VLPARDAAGQIPVVFVATFDPVATGLVASLARPGGNITGMTSISGDVIAKRLQLVTESPKPAAAPGVPTHAAAWVAAQRANCTVDALHCPGSTPNCRATFALSLALWP
jgi:hypothetical protein